LRHKAVIEPWQDVLRTPVESRNTFEGLTVIGDALTLSTVVIKANPSKGGDAKPPV